MKIVIAADIFFPSIGGPATYSGKIAHALIRAHHTVDVICYSDNIHSKDTFPFTITRIPLSRTKIKHYAAYTKKLFSLARRADVVYAQGPVASGFPAVIVGTLLRKKMVVKVVGDYAWERARLRGITKEGIDTFQKNTQGGFSAILQRIQKFTVQCANQVIVPSAYLKTIVEGWGVTNENITVIYNAAPNKTYIRKENREYDTIVSIGRLVPWKGFEALIRAMPDLLARNKKFRLLILGDGPLRERLFELIKELELEHYVKIQKANSDEVDTILKEATFFVLNTEYEGLSHALLEVMTAGVPIITTPVGGNPELIEHEKNGLFIPFNDTSAITSAILHLWKNPRSGQRFVEESKHRIRQFTEEHMLRASIKLLESI
jgi:glycosyltransferase involved in cell wall biosynthesis